MSTILLEYYNLFKNFFNKEQNKNIILDPLTCIIKLGLLTFKPKGTKISINNNSISFHEPNILQGPIRWSQGDAREDLHNLFYPIVKATQWYDIRSETIKNIFTFSKNGLEILSHSYNKNSTISHSIKHYINIIEKTQSGNEIIPEDETNSIYQELKNLWTNREIDIINSLFLEIADNKKDINKMNNLINAINLILNTKESNLRKIIIESSTILI